MAVSFEGKSLTYRDLNARANQLARYLQALGIRPEVLVGICMERSDELVITILGILKAGGACLPLDPAYPKERLAFTVEDAQPAVILTQKRLLKCLPTHTAKEICLDADWSRIAQHSNESLENMLTDENLAFLLYTSGSTGQPKAVMVPHRRRDPGPSPDQERFQMTPEDRHILKSSIGFTLLIREIFWPLLTGGKLIIAPPGTEQDISYLVNLIANHKITLLTLTPSLLSAFMEESGFKNCAALRHVICFGEPLTYEQQIRFFSCSSAELSVYYGATEAPSAMVFKCDRESLRQFVVLGRPLPNKEIYLLDDGLRPVPVGFCGELHIGGRLARGYFNRPDLTAERFIPNPFAREPGARLYRTGDLGRYLPDGSIEFVGRVDNQIKIRGFRIEPAEIEKVLVQHPAVKQALVAAPEDPSGNKRLVAYVAPKPGLTVGSSDLRNFLTEKLPHYMVPSSFVLLADLPLNDNGKVDRRALPDPGNSRPELATPFVAARTPVEKEVARIWAEVLCLDQVGVHDNFLDLGGHSLTASQVVSRVMQTFQLDLPVQSLFQSPTVAEMAEVIAQNQAKKLSAEQLGRILADLEALSDEQAQELVAQGGAETIKDK